VTLRPTHRPTVRAANGKVKLVKMNIDEHPAIPGQMGIQSIPAVIAFVNGQPADGFMGAVPESQVTAFINKLTAGMPGEPNIAEILKEAEAVLAEGDPTTAASIYAEVLAADATNIAALAGLAVATSGGRPLLGDERRPAAPEDAGLLGRDRAEGAAEDGGVVIPDRRDDGERGRHRVRRVLRAPQPDLEDRDPAAELGEGAQRECQEQLECRRLARLLEFPRRS